MEPKLIKIDRNGSKHYEGMVTCERCGGLGYYAIGIMNDHLVLSPLDNGVCWKCGGAGKVKGKWIERTSEYQAKLDARREAKRKAEAEKRSKEQAEAEAIRKAEEERIKAEKAISQYVGNVGERITVKATYVKSASYEARSFSGFGTNTTYIHTFKDADGNKLIWKTTASLGTWLENGDWQSHEYGENVDLTGTVKYHKEYKDEKQTVLTRCKLNWKGAML